MDLVVKETSLFTVELLVDRIAALASAGGVTTPGWWREALMWVSCTAATE